MEHGEDDDFEPGGRREREVAGELAEERAEFVGLMQHFYRGELGRVTAWRARLDRTTNWAAGLMATLITWSFSASDRPHYIILGSLAVVTVFLGIEARRYRTYDVWRSRVRLVEENIFANAADPEGVVHERWRALLANDLRKPTIKVPLLEALSRRLRRVYFPLITIIIVSWTFRITVFPPDEVSVWQAASIESVSGLIVISAVSVFYITMIGLTVGPTDRLAMGKKQKPSEQPEGWRKE